MHHTALPAESSTWNRWPSHFYLPAYGLMAGLPYESHSEVTLPPGLLRTALLMRTMDLPNRFRKYESLKRELARQIDPAGPLYEGLIREIARVAQL